MNYQIIPAVIAKDQEELDYSLDSVGGLTEIIQLDFMDGVFVPNKSLDFDFQVDDEYSFEAHLMVADPMEWIKNFSDRVDTILFHYESTGNPEVVLDLIKSAGCRAGLTINPKTKVDEITPYLPLLDEILVMTVEPGFYGSKFIPDCLKKVSEIRNLSEDLVIEVDGGITDETIRLAAEAGANYFVSGSYIVKNERPQDAINELKKESQVM